MLNKRRDRKDIAIQCLATGRCHIAILSVEAFDVDAFTTYCHCDVTFLAFATHVDAFFLRLDHAHRVELSGQNSSSEGGTAHCYPPVTRLTVALAELVVDDALTLCIIE